MRKVFVGSSSEALGYARQVCDLLATQPNIVPILWTEIFAPGSLTFEAIEKVARETVGVVLLATPDDNSLIREKTVKVPRTNVMIEFGFLTAALGRSRIALCKCAGVELPTDLSGFTYIPMGEYQGPKGNPVISPSTVAQIVQWAQCLPNLPAAVPLTSIMHGYSGRWKIKNRFTRWRSFNVVPPNYVDFEGLLDLSLGRHGSNGNGFVHGNIYASVNNCYAHISFGARVENVFCDAQGILRFVSKMHSRQVIAVEGAPPFQDGFSDAFRGPQHGVWELSPISSEGAQLKGSFVVSAGAQPRDEAECVVEKLPAA